jgi:shikimate kinase
VLPPATDALLDPVTTIDGFQLAGLIDASTGMVLAAAQDGDDLSLSTAAAGAADIAGVLSHLTGALAVSDELEDVMVTFNNHFQLIRMLRPTPTQTVILLVILDRAQANLAMARHAIRNFCASFA